MRIASTALPVAILVAVVCLLITPARHWTQDLATCRNGDRVKPTTVVAKDGRTAEDFAFVCRKVTGPIGIAQSSATLGGIGVSLVLGLLAGALLGGLLALRHRTS